MPVKSALGANRQALLGLCLGIGLPPLGLGCTLLENEFQPPLATLGDAGRRDGGAATAAAAGQAGLADPACGSAFERGQEGSLCAGAIVISRPDGGSPGGGVRLSSPAARENSCLGGLGELGEPERVSGFAVEGELFGPSISADGLTLYFAVASDGVEHIYTASRSRLYTAQFSEAVELTATSSTRQDGTPFISLDGLSLYFFSDRDGGAGRRDLWGARRADPRSTFGPAVELGALNTAALELSPWLTPDGLTLFFASSRPNGRDGAEDTDIWRSTRESTERGFEQADNAAELNSAGNEGRIVFSTDGRLAFFSSDRPGGSGYPDIWMLSRADADSPFGPAQNLARLNSPAADHDVSLTRDDRELFFASARGGQSELWHAVRRCL